jgi:GWxTD domain-containing protein
LAITVQIYDIDNDLILFQESWNRDLILDRYETTRSTEDKFSFDKDINLDPGEYELIVNIEDLDNGNVIKSKERLSLSTSNGFGEIVLFVMEKLDTYKEVDFKLSLDHSQFKLLFQYFGDDIDKLTLEITNNKNIFNQSYKDLIIDDDGFYTINFTLPEGYYGDIDLVISSSKDEISKELFLYDNNAMLWSNDIAEIVGVMRYIFSSKEMKTLKEMDEKQKIDFIINYWKDKDPTEDTKENELLIEFTDRFNFANENLSEIGRGWRTDRGKIYIIYGEPESIERFSSQDNSIFETWIYPSGLEFVFQDRNRFGNFILVRQAL